MILVVDDDEGVREALQAALCAHGYAVRAESCGRAAIRAMSEAVPAVVVTDIHMQEGDGFGILSHAHSLPVRPAVVLVSAWNDPADRTRAHRLGAVAYLAKPFEMSRLLAIVRGHCPPDDRPACAP